MMKEYNGKRMPRKIKKALKAYWKYLQENENFCKETLVFLGQNNKGWLSRDIRTISRINNQLRIKSKNK